MTTTVTAAMRELLTAGQEAVRAVERYGSPDTVAGLDKALCALPLLDMDDQAHRILNDALRSVARAEDAETWDRLTTVEQALSVWLHYPDRTDLGNAAMLAVAELAVHCGAMHGRAVEGSAERRAWDGAHLAGAEALRKVVSATSGNATGRELDSAIRTFLEAVRRAVPYVALIGARYVLVEFARTYGLFVVGMRQPMPEGPWEWARRLGGAVYLFRVDPPGLNGHPYGSVAVQRLAEDGTAGPVRSFGLFSLGERRNALNAARERI
ncbi:hypothetical protein [Streptomyces bottropensis]|uniref:hypothetical protein n=1 Tax=Streptomyces bottropensis TaxID=42235 RepID=UPI0036B3C080